MCMSLASLQWQSSSSQAAPPPPTICTSTQMTSPWTTPSELQRQALLGHKHTPAEACQARAPSCLYCSTWKTTTYASPVKGRQDAHSLRSWCRVIGIRFHPTRGAMSLGESKGGLPPDSCTEDEAACLADMQRCIEEFHDNSRHFFQCFSAMHMPPSSLPGLAAVCRCKSAPLIGTSIMQAMYHLTL